MTFLWGVGWQKFFSPEFVSLAQPRRTLQNPKKVFVRVKFVLLRRFNQAVNHAAGLRATGRIGKQPVLSAHHKGLNAALGTVVAQLLNTPPETVRVGRTNGAAKPLKWCKVTAAMVH